MTVALYTDITAADVVNFCKTTSRLDAATMLVVVAFANEVKGNALCVSEDSPTLRLARLNLAAHFAINTLQGRGGAAGPVTAEAAGAVRRSYGLMMSSSTSGGLGSTMYGQAYLAILNMTEGVRGPFVV